MTLKKRLLAAAELWAREHNRSEATLSSRVANDGKLFERLRAGSSVNVTTAERFFAFFRDPITWASGVPAGLADLLDSVDLGVVAHEGEDGRADGVLSPGKVTQVSAEVSA